MKGYIGSGVAIIMSTGRIISHDLKAYGMHMYLHIKVVKLIREESLMHAIFCEI
jgi:hypothetical protein